MRVVHAINLSHTVQSTCASRSSSCCRIYNVDVDVVVVVVVVVAALGRAPVLANYQHHPPLTPTL